MKTMISELDERTAKMIAVLILVILFFLAAASICVFIQRLTDAVWNIYDFKAHMDAVTAGLY